MRFQGKVLLSTFGGESASFGTMGWEGWLQALKAELDDEVRLYLVGLGPADVQVFFMPSFFLPPDKFAALPYVDGMFNWNSAW